MEIIFHSHANKTHFHKKGCAPGLILKVRVLELGRGLFLLGCCDLTQEKWKTKVMQNKVHYGRCASGVLPQTGLDFLPETGVLVREHGKDLITSETVWYVCTISLSYKNEDIY